MATADTLVISDSNSAGDVAYAEIVFGCKARGCFLVVGSIDELVQRVRSYDSIKRLVFLFHGYSGGVVVHGTTLDLDKFAEKLHGAKTVVTTEIRFEACNLAGKPRQAAPLLRVLRAPSLVAYVGFHTWAPIPITMRRGDSAADLNKQMSPVRDYLLPNQPSFDDLVRRAPTSISLWAEYWSRDPDSGYLGRIMSRTAVPDSLHFPSRKVLKKQTLRVDSLPESLDKPDAIFEITIVPAPNPQPSPKPGGRPGPQPNPTR